MKNASKKVGVITYWNRKVFCSIFLRKLQKVELLFLGQVYTTAVGGGDKAAVTGDALAAARAPAPAIEAVGESGGLATGTARRFLLGSSCHNGAVT